MFVKQKLQAKNPFAKVFSSVAEIQNCKEKKTVKKVNGNALLGKIKFARNKRNSMSRKPKQFPNVTFLYFDKLSSP